MRTTYVFPEVGEVHAVSVPLPGDDVVPAGHGRQVSCDVAPDAAEKVFEAHLVHVVSEVADREDEKVPASHLVQSKVPGADEYFPDSHSMHAEAPGDGKYLPAAHACLSATAPSQ